MGLQGRSGIVPLNQKGTSDANIHCRRVVIRVVLPPVRGLTPSMVTSSQPTRLNTSSLPLGVEFVDWLTSYFNAPWISRYRLLWLRFMAMWLGSMTIVATDSIT